MKMKSTGGFNLFKLILSLIMVLVFYNSTWSKKYSVKDEVELQKIMTNLAPGDSVILKNGQWKNKNITFSGNGNEQQPIYFIAESTGNVVFVGQSKVKISGSYLVVSGLTFKDGYLTESGSIIEFRDGSNVANHCRLTNVTIDGYNPPDWALDYKWISLYGTHNRVDHCSLTGKTNSGTTLVVWLDETPDYHLIDHNYFGPRPALGINGGETIRIGTSDWSMNYSNSIVENNLFDNCDGEIEIISNKSCGNIYRYNTFYQCDGTLTLRHGNDCKVYGNFFIGKEGKNCGGVRIIGTDHKVYNNYFEGLYGTEYRAAISVVNGVPNSPLNRYFQVERAEVTFNTIVNCKEPFAIGSGKSSEQSLSPVNSTFAANLIKHTTTGPIVKLYDSNGEINWVKNIFDGDNLGIQSQGFTTVPLNLNKDDIFRPTNPEPLRIIEIGTFTYVDFDVDIQKRPSSNRMVGCDETSNEPVLSRPLKKNEVGPEFSTILGKSSEDFKNKLRSSLTTNGLLLSFDTATPKCVIVYDLQGKIVYKDYIASKDVVISTKSYSGLMLVRVWEKSDKYSFKISI